MKKIIKLTKSDLTRIVKRVIKENSVKDDLTQMIKYDDWKSTAELVGGDKNLLKIIGITTPMDFLHLFDDLSQVQSKELENSMLFRYKSGRNIMIYDRNNGWVYISYYDIWSVLKYEFGLNNSEIKQLIQEWLSETYNLRGITPQRGIPLYMLPVV